MEKCGCCHSTATSTIVHIRGPRITDIYEDFKQNAPLPLPKMYFLINKRVIIFYYRVGNTQEMLKYRSNGDASDWLLGKHDKLTI